MTNTKQKNKSKNYLRSMHIRRFRSIADLNIQFAPITIFVGANDSGKSNILKAVNLFFNNEVDYTTPYEYSRDYLKNANKGKGYSESVGITARINYPRDRKGTITASKYWKEDGFSTRNSSVTYVPEVGRSRIPKWYDRLNYRYVPANKGDEYMKVLMRELYNQFAANINSDIRLGATDFMENIRKETSTISDEIKDMLGLDSRIQLPEDISTLFELFDFETDNKISLKQRGDGIRVRHIPAILNFLADRKNQPFGSVRGETIWGYEEPENNLELMAAFEQAKQFIKYSSNVQILITTHSPAFYQMIASEDNCKGYYVKKDQNKTEINEITEDDIHHVNSDMGLMPLVAPYIHTKQIEIDQKNELLGEYKKSEWARDKKMIVVEGDFDKAVLQHCMKEISSKDIYIHVAGGGNGVGQIINARYLACKGHRNNCIGLLDRDDTGRQVKNMYKECDKKHQNWLKLLDLPRHMYGLVTEHKEKIDIKKVAINLETLLPVCYWEYAKNKGLLEFSSFFLNDLKGHLWGNDASIEKAQEDYPENWLYLCYKVKRDAKDEFKKLVMNKLKEKKELPPALEAEIQHMVEFLQSK